eukprot:CFRG4134T1
MRTLAPRNADETIPALTIPVMATTNVFDGLELNETEFDLKVGDLLCDPDPRVAKMISSFQTVKEVKREWQTEGKTLRFGKVQWTGQPMTQASLDQTYRHENFESNGILECEMVELTTRSGEYDGCDVVARMVSENEDLDRLVLVINYRAPLGNACIELPSGLMKEGETPEQAAVRRLSEETGLKGTVANVSPALYTDPWKSNESTMLVDVEVNVDDPENLDLILQRANKCDQCVVVAVPIENLLQRLLRYFNMGLDIDTKLYSLAYGLEMAARVTRRKTKMARRSTQSPSLSNI